MSEAHLPLILRAFPKSRPRRKRRTPPPGWTRHVLLIDTETTTDPTQRLLFGSYQFARWEDGELGTREEGLFYGDDLPDRDPDGFAVLRDYATAEGLKLYSRREFVNGPFWKAAYEAGATVVGFNLPFDLSRLAVRWTKARGRDRGGFSFVLWDRWDEAREQWVENKYRPRLIVNHVDSKRAFIHFKGGRDIPKNKRTRGRFLDLRTLAFALTSRGHSLRSACEAFGLEGKGAAERHGVITPEYIDYNRQDVRASKALCVGLRRELEAYPVSLDPCRAYSPASIAKAALDEVGVGLPKERFSRIPEEVHGHAMIAYYGGRSDVRIRRALVPVVMVDFLSMYPTVNALMDTWRYLTAAELDVVDCTEEVRELLERIELNDCFDPATWKKVVFLAEVEPHEDILPVRTRYDGQNRNIGINYLTSSIPVWYTGADVIAAKLLTGRAPRVLRAYGLRPDGKAKKLKELDFGHGLRVDPLTEDLFRKLIELRKTLGRRGVDELNAARLGTALKIIANSGAYGVLAEMNVRDRTAKDPAAVYGLADFETDADKIEEPGRFAFPFIAAMTTGAARLMLAMLERSVTDRGGSYAFCDTDSMAIVASNEGSTVDVAGDALHVLTWEDVEDVRELFRALNPYDQSLIDTSILELESENFHQGQRRQLYAWAISAKRYALTAETPEGMEIVKFSEHGLGHLINPAGSDAEDGGWFSRFWQWILGSESGKESEEPPWLDRPALSRITASSPVLMEPFHDWNEGRAYPDQIKPFNFMLGAHVAELGHPVGSDPTRFHLVARYEQEPEEWTALEWTDRYSRQVVPVTTEGVAAPDCARIKSIRDVAASFVVHPEAKSAGADGSPCGRSTRGLLRRRHIIATGVEYIGKESHRYEEVDAGMIHDPSEVTIAYGSDEWGRLKHRLHDFPARALAEVADVAERSIKYYRAGREPTDEVKQRLLEFFRRA